MPVLPIEIGQFGGLDLRDDAQEIQHTAAIDMLNVDLDQPGRMRSRDGYAKLTVSPAAGAYYNIKPYYTAPGSATKHLIAARSGGVDAINTSGTVVSTAATTALSLVPFGDPSSTVMYAIPSTTTTWFKWNGSTWAAGPTQYATNAVVHASDNRMMAINGSRVSFSDAGAPETFGANNWVDITPGDGEQAFCSVSWRDKVFVFKQTKFFVFGTTTLSGSGNPIFNYYPVDAGVGAMGRHAACASPNGVYFADPTGVYLTTGGPPTKVSGSLDPLYGRGTLTGNYTGSALNWTQMNNYNALTNVVLGWYNGRLHLSLSTGASSTNDRTFVLDTATGQWLAWDLKVNAIASFKVGGQEEMMFALSSGSNDVCRFGSSYTTDAGSAISAKYRTGFVTPAVFSSARTRRGYPWPGAEGVVREWLIDGSGTVTVKTAFNDSTTLGTGASVTLGTSPAIAQGRDRRAVRGRNVSIEVSGTGPWSVSRVIANTMASRGPGMEAA